MVVQSGVYERLKGRDRQALAVEELSAAEIEAISRGEPPALAAATCRNWVRRAIKLYRAQG